MLATLRRYTPFFIAFFSALIVFGSMFGIACYLVLNQDETVDSIVSNVPIVDDSYTPTAEDNLTVVFMANTEQNLSPSCYLLLHFNAVTNQCTVMSIPPNTQVSLDNTAKTVEECYRWGGMERAAQAISSYFALDNAYYLRTDYEQLQAFGDYFSGVTYTLEQEITTDEFHFQAGKQLLDGARMASLLLSGEFTGKAELMQTFLLSHMNADLMNRLESFYDFLFAHADTSLNRVLLHRLNKPAYRFLRSPYDKVTAVQLDAVQKDGILLPNAQQTEELRQKFTVDSIPQTT